MGGSSAEGLMLVAGIIELVGGLAIVLGTYVGYAAVIAGLEMIYALVTVHFSKGFNPLENGGEAALLYLAAFLVLATHGAGKWTVGSPGKKK
jgi:putative oxidoreductase